MPDQAEIHRKCISEKIEDRREAIWLLETQFSNLPDKDQAWKDLHGLVQDKDSFVQVGAIVALGRAFSQVHDKDQAWMDLHSLTQDKDDHVRGAAAGPLGTAFSQVPDKDQAWQDLLRLIKDDDSDVQRWSADSLGTAFSEVPDKDQAWQDLHGLAKDEDSSVRMYAYHSLGRASVFKAIEADGKVALQKELEAAVTYFEKSSQEHNFGPAEFCYPFYRTYLMITFQDAKEDEVQRYLADAKEAVGGSESKDELLKTVENLARALSESQRLKYRSVQEVARELNTYRLYCEKAAEYMAAAEDKVPGAVKLMKRCNPLLEGRIKAIIAEIQKKARLIGPEIDRAARCLSLGDPIKVHQC